MTLKLGGSRLSKTNNSEVGTFSARHTLQLVRNGAITVHKVILAPTYGPMGVMGIRKNIQAITGPSFKKMLPDKKCLVVVMVDGISIESRINVDTSIHPMVFTGSCRHCENNVFNSMDDAKIFQEELKEGKFHVASERK